jgi:hypothetical protein
MIAWVGMVGVSLGLTGCKSDGFWSSDAAPRPGQQQASSGTGMPGQGQPTMANSGSMTGNQQQPAWNGTPARFASGQPTASNQNAYVDRSQMVPGQMPMTGQPAGMSDSYNANPGRAVRLMNQPNQLSIPGNPASADASANGVMPSSMSGVNDGTQPIAVSPATSSYNRTSALPNRTTDPYVSPAAGQERMGNGSSTVPPTPKPEARESNPWGRYSVPPDAASGQRTSTGADSSVHEVPAPARSDASSPSRSTGNPLMSGSDDGAAMGPAGR